MLDDIRPLINDTRLRGEIFDVSGIRIRRVTDQIQDCLEVTFRKVVHIWAL
jgi:hypothetical protein